MRRKAWPHETKAGCVVLGAHGADTVTTGAQQVWDGKEKSSLTQRGTAAAAQAMGARPETAAVVGLTVDIAVPIAFSLGIGAARIAALRAGRIKLIEHEAQGGHTILKHVGKSEADLRARLVREPWLRGAASSFPSLDVAERAISQGLRANSVAIKAWARSATVTSKPHPFKYNVGSVVGHGVVRATGKLTQMTKIIIVLKYATYKGKPYYILTAYPTHL